MSANWQQEGLTLEQRVEAVLTAMTDDEKFAWLSGPMAIPVGKTKIPEGAIGSAGFYPGIPRLNIPSIQQSDASLGVSALGGIRPGEEATALPANLLLGSTFNPTMAERTGALLGHEAFAKGFNVQLAGGANLIREPRGGRNFEYISEDPLLTGMIAGHSVKGIQSQHVVSTVKHFAVNPQETGRVVISSNIEEAALRESDLLAFELAITIGKPGSVMTGYNLVNGDWAGENDFILNRVLKGDWKFQGWVMSDWGATHCCEKAALAGLDVQSGANLDKENWFGEPLRQAVKRGEVPQERIDDMVRRILHGLFQVGAIEVPAKRFSDIDYSEHLLIAQREAEQGIVLLKNANGILPLPRGLAKILVIGEHADFGVPSGGGSSAVTPIGCLQLDGVNFMGISTPKVYVPASPLLGIKRESWAKEVEFYNGENSNLACQKAKDADVVIIFADEWRSEALDRQGLGIDEKIDKLITSVAAVNSKTIVVLETGGPVLMPWLEQVPAVLEAWYSGSAGGTAIAGVLFGRVNPSGRLPVTFPANEQQLPHPDQIDPSTTTSMPFTEVKGDILHMDYNVEGSDVGYRWFERANYQPLFPFGFGLSYTEFTHQNLAVTTDTEGLVIEVTVSNSGKRDGADVVQVYLRPEDNAYPSRLVAFERVELKAGEAKRLRLVAEPKVVANWASDKQQWLRKAGKYSIIVAKNAREASLSSTISLDEQVFGY
jgi:beta-glucosidase